MLQLFRGRGMREVKGSQRHGAASALASTALLTRDRWSRPRPASRTLLGTPWPAALAAQRRDAGDRHRRSALRVGRPARCCWRKAEPRARCRAACASTSTSARRSAAASRSTRRRLDHGPRRGHATRLRRLRKLRRARCRDRRQRTLRARARTARGCTARSTATPTRCSCKRSARSTTETGQMTRARPALRRLLPQTAVLCACLAAMTSARVTSARAATSATLGAKFTP